MDIKARLQHHIRNATQRWISAHRAIYGPALDRIDIADTDDGITVRIVEDQPPRKPSRKRKSADTDDE